MSNENYIAVIEGAVYHRGKYLFIVRALHDDYCPGLLALPGGKVEPVQDQESVLEHTVRREIQEEVGLDLTGPVEYVWSKTFALPDGRLILDTIFLCRYTGGTPTPDPNEVAEILWLSPEELASHPGAELWLLHGLSLIEEKRKRLGW